MNKPFWKSKWWPCPLNRGDRSIEAKFRVNMRSRFLKIDRWTLNRGWPLNWIEVWLYVVQPGIELGSLNRSSYPGQKCLGQCCSIFFNFLVPSKNSATYPKMSRSSPSTLPYSWDGGRGWACVISRKPNKCKFVPRFCPIDCSLDAGKTTQPLN